MKRLVLASCVFLMLITWIGFLGVCTSPPQHGDHVVRTWSCGPAHFELLEHPQ